MKQQFRTAIVLLCILPAMGSVAQSASDDDPGLQFRFQHLAEKDGLSHRRVKCIYQDRSGFIWFGTKYGLNRFDGNEFKSYYHDPSDSLTLLHSNVKCITEDSRGMLWIGTQVGLSRLDPATESFTHLIHDPDDGGSLAGGRVRSILSDQDGSIWVGTENGLDRLNPVDMTIEHIDLTQDLPRTRGMDYISALLKDSRGQLWAGTARGLFVYDPVSRSSEHHVWDKKDSESLKGHYVYSIFEDGEKEIWVGTTHALLRYDRNSGSFVKYWLPGDSNYSRRVWATDIEEDAEGRLWITSHKHSLLIFDRDESQISRVTHIGGETQSLSQGALDVVFRDRNSRMWVGTREAGINSWTPHRIIFDLYSNKQNQPYSLSSSTIRAVCVDRDGYLWIGGSNGLNMIDRRTGSFKHFTKSETGLISKNVRVIYEDPDRGSNILWIGTKGAGLHSYDRMKDTFTHYPYYSDGIEGLKGNNVTSLVKDRNGILWIGTLNGLHSFDESNGRFRLYAREEGNSAGPISNAVTKVLEDSEGYLWTCTRRGISRLDRDRGSFQHFLEYSLDSDESEYHGVNTVLERSDGSFWFGSAGGGLYRLDRESSELESFTTDDGLPNNFVSGILEDGKGNLWISTARGLTRLDTEMLFFRNYCCLPGVMGNEFMPNAAFRSSSGEMFFGGIGGLNTFHPAEVQFDSSAPPVELVDFKLFNSSVQVRSRDEDLRTLGRAINHIDRLELSHRDHVFSFQYAALNYTDPDHNGYAYILEGFEDEWNYVGNSRLATYSHVPSGRYVFKVKASNSEGIWNDVPASLEVVITSPFWRSTWFRAIVLLLVIALPVAHYRMVAARMMRRNRILAESNSRLESEANLRHETESALKESESRFRSLVENAPEIMYRISDSKGSLYFSPSVETVLGHSVSMHYEDPFLWRNSIHSADIPLYDRSVRGFHASGPIEIDYRIKDAKGQWHWIEDRSISGKRYGEEMVIEGIARDVTELREAEESLRMIKRAVNNFGDEYYFIDSRMKIRDTNIGACEAMGFTREELLGMKISDINPDFTQGKFNDLLHRARNEKDVLFETIHRTKSGRVYPVEVLTHHLVVGDEDFLFGFVRDISERRSREETLKLSQAVMRNASDSIFWITGDARIRYVNDAAVSGLGYSREELLEMSVLDIDPLMTMERAMEMWETLKIEKDMLIESVHRTKSGEEFPIELRLNFTEHNGKEQLFVFACDISARKKAELELKGAFGEIKELKNQLEAENLLLRREVTTILGHRSITGESIVMRKILAQAAEVSSTSSTVLLMGETGTGKELIARAIHEMSPRKNRPFVTVNCAAIPSTLIESELFGREKGAYTGALTSQIGRFEVADGATIFLDEIGELSLEAQAKLLRILQEGEFERLGSTKTRKIDVRIIVATNRDLENDVRNKIFRNDLYYRLNVFPIQVPPLRDRCEDIPLLIRHFVKEFNDKMGKSVEKIPRSTMEGLQKYHWPGNVRELRNVIERGMILAHGSTLRAAPPKTRELDVNGSQDMSLDEIQKKHIIEVLDRTGWKVRGKGGAAEILDLKPSTLESKMVKLGIRRPSSTPR